MSFSSFSDFVSMGHHGFYIWSAYGLGLGVIALNVAVAIGSRKRLVRELARRQRREEAA